MGQSATWLTPASTHRWHMVNRLWGPESKLASNFMQFGRMTVDSKQMSSVVWLHPLFIQVGGVKGEPLVRRLRIFNVVVDRCKKLVRIMTMKVQSKQFTSLTKQLTSTWHSVRIEWLSVVVTDDRQIGTELSHHMRCKQLC